MIMERNSAVLGRVLLISTLIVACRSVHEMAASSGLSTLENKDSERQNVINIYAKRSRSGQQQSAQQQVPWQQAPNFNDRVTQAFGGPVAFDQSARRRKSPPSRPPQNTHEQFDDEPMMDIPEEFDVGATRSNPVKFDEELPPNASEKLNEELPPNAFEKSDEELPPNAFEKFDEELLPNAPEKSYEEPSVPDMPSNESLKPSERTDDEEKALEGSQQERQESSAGPLLVSEAPELSAKPKPKRIVYVVLFEVMYCPYCWRDEALRLFAEKEVPMTFW